MRVPFLPMLLHLLLSPLHCSAPGRVPATHLPLRYSQDATTSPHHTLRFAARGANIGSLPSYDHAESDGRIPFTTIAISMGHPLPLRTW